MKKIFYLGPKDSYSHLVIKKVFENGDYSPVSCKTFGEIVSNTISSPGSLGTLPIENSITSDIHENIDYLFKNNLWIMNEAFLRINLCLVGLSDAKEEGIKKVYSHPRALAQCKRFIQSHNLATEETQSTSNARDIILKEENKSLAVIGSKELVSSDKLKIIKENIGDDKFNMTRFVFVSNKEKKDVTIINNKASVIFNLPHTPGSLAKLLAQFAEKNINLTKIESRPIPGTDWEYQFWVDIEDTNSALDINAISFLLKNHSQSYKIKGIYNTGKIFES